VAEQAADAGLDDALTTWCGQAGAVTR
jgi:hypothetical protein